MSRSVVVGLLGHIRLEEVEERLTAVLARHDGLNGSSFSLGLRGLSGIVCSEL